MSKKPWGRIAIKIRRWAGSYLQTRRQEFLQAADSPPALAAAFALGTLTSFFPVPILDSLLAVGLTVRFERLNKSAIFMARLVWNDLLVVPLYAPGFRVGQYVVTAVLDTQGPILIAHSQFLWLLCFLAGVAILASFAALLCFLIVFFCAKMAQSKKLIVVKY